MKKSVVGQFGFIGTFSVFIGSLVDVTPAINRNKLLSIRTSRIKHFHDCVWNERN